MRVFACKFMFMRACVCVAGEADGWERAKRTSCHCGSTNWRCCDVCAGVVCYPHPHASEHA